MLAQNQKHKSSRSFALSASRHLSGEEVCGGRFGGGTDGPGGASAPPGPPPLLPPSAIRTAKFSTIFEKYIFEKLFRQTFIEKYFLKNIFRKIFFKKYFAKNIFRKILFEKHDSYSVNMTASYSVIFGKSGYYEQDGNIYCTEHIL